MLSASVFSESCFLADAYATSFMAMGFEKSKKLLDQLKEIEDNNQVAIYYCNNKGLTDEKFNPNGSIKNIAGIFNKEKNVLGMMPHPERATCEITKLSDGENLFKSISEFLL